MAFSYARPDVDSADGGWSNQAGSQTNLYASIDETVADDADYISSSPGNSNDVVKLSLSDVSSVSNPTTVRYRYKKNDGGDPATVNMQASLLQGSTVIASWQHNDIGTSYTLAEQSLTGGQFSAISDLTNLFLQFQTTWWLTDASIDLDFRDALYYDSSDPTVAVTDFLSCSRASIGYAKNADGTLTQFGNDTLRIGVGTGLLVEDARTNQIVYSQQINATNWGSDGSTFTTYTDNAAVAPDGTTTMSQMFDSTGNGRHMLVVAGFALNNITDVCWSMFVKDVDRRYVVLALTERNTGTDEIFAYYDLQTGTVSYSQANGTTTLVSANIEAYGNSIYRLSLSGTFTNEGIYAELFTSNASSGISGPSYIGSNKSVYVWGAQLELALFPSSYIPTTTAAATRAADAVTFTGNLDTIVNALPNSILVDLISNYVPTDFSWAGIIRNGQVLLAPFGDDSEVYATGPNISATLGGGRLFSTGVKIAISQSATARSMVGGGGTVSSDANTGYAISSAKFNTGTKFCYNRRLTVWNSRLADATLQALTAP